MVGSPMRSLAPDSVYFAFLNSLRDEDGKGHRQALRALARRRVDLIYALLSNGTFYEPSF